MRSHHNDSQLSSPCHGDELEPGWRTTILHLNLLGADSTSTASILCTSNPTRNDGTQFCSSRSCRVASLVAYSPTPNCGTVDRAKHVLSTTSSESCNRLGTRQHCSGANCTGTTSLVMKYCWWWHSRIRWAAPPIFFVTNVSTKHCGI